MRHGETEANAENRATGNKETPLTAKGLAGAADARRVVEALSVPPRKIFHSPLSRARITAEVVNANLRVPLQVHPDLIEHAFGAWQGLPWPTVRAWLNEGREPEGGETFQALEERVVRAMTAILADPEDPLLVVGHGGFARALLRVCGRTLPIGAIRNTTLYELTPPSAPEASWDVGSYTLAPNGTLVREVVDGSEATLSPLQGTSSFGHKNGGGHDGSG